MTGTRSDITGTIGGTPLVELSRIASPTGCRILAKVESMNPCSSVKDRIALAMVEAAESAGALEADSLLVEPTSGNTGIGLAMVAAVKGYRLVLTMPETMSMERRRILKALGADLVLTPGPLGMKGAEQAADRIVASRKDAVLLQQFKNSANPAAHDRTTAMEIWDDTEGSVDVLVAGVGTGGTITGVGRRLRELKPSIRVIAVEPADSPVLSGGVPGPHSIQGIGAGFIPDILEVDIIDEVVTVTADEAYTTARSLARSEGILAGISSGAALSVALKVSERPDMAGRTLVVILPDTGERYMSTPLFEDPTPMTVDEYLSRDR